MRFGIREVIFLLVLLAVPVASGWYVFKPRNELIQSAKQEIEEKQVKLERLREETAKMVDLGLEIERGREMLAEVEAKLPARQDVEGILEQVWQLAEKNRQAVKSVKGDDNVKGPGHLELPLKVVMEGDFDGFYQFLLDLEDYQRITRIHEMKLERLIPSRGPRTGDIAPGAMKAEFTLSIYFEP